MWGGVLPSGAQLLRDEDKMADYGKGSRSGLFITLEGGDGCGKTTQIERLTNMLDAMGWQVVRLREPGGTPISEKIRQILLNPAHTEMVDECELLLMEASRAQLVRQTILPELEAGHAVLCDRFFDSTYAYQAGGRGLPDEMIEAANNLGSCGLVPDITIVLDLEPAQSFDRATQGKVDRLEGEGLSFQERVRDAYLRLAQSEPERVRIVDAHGTPDEVFERVKDALRDVLQIPSARMGRLHG